MVLPIPPSPVTSVRRFVGDDGLDDPLSLRLGVVRHGRRFDDALREVALLAVGVASCRVFSTPCSSAPRVLRRGILLRGVYGLVTERMIAAPSFTTHPEPVASFRSLPLVDVVDDHFATCRVPSCGARSRPQACGLRGRPPEQRQAFDPAQDRECRDRRPSLRAPMTGRRLIAAPSCTSRRPRRR